MRQETGDFLVGEDPKLITHNIFSCDMKFSREIGHFFIQPPHEKISCVLYHEKISCLMIFSFGIYGDMRFSHDTGDFILRQETGDFIVGGDPKLKRHDIFSWAMRFSHETGDRRFS